MQRQHTGRPGTVVVPTAWQATHAAVIAKTLPSTVTITPPGTGVAAFNPTTHQSETPAATASYDGPAEIMLVTDTDRLAEAAGEDVPTRRYEVKLLHSATGVEPGHVVRVTACADPDLGAGTRLVVDAVERGSQRFSRVLYATLTH